MKQFLTGSWDTTICDTRLLFDVREKKAAFAPPPLYYYLVLHADENSIAEAWREKLYRFLAGYFCAANYTVETLGGTTERLYLLVGLNSTEAPADFVRRVKLVSQSWISRETPHRQFVWRDECEAFTVSLSQCENVRRDIFKRSGCGISFTTGKNDFSARRALLQRNFYAV